MNQRVDKDSLKIDQPRRTPGHPTKSHIVKTKIDGKEKILRFGEQGAETAGKPKEGESDRMKAKRASFKSRHAKNIAKGKSSPAYWANKVKWAEGGPVTGMAVGGGWGQMAAAGPVGGSAKAAADREKEKAKEAYGQAAASMKQAGVTGIGGGAKPADRPGDMRERTFAGDLGNLIELYGVDDDNDSISPEMRAYLSSTPGTVAEPVIGPMPAPSAITMTPLGDNVAPVSQPSQPAQPAGFFGQLMALPGAIGRDLKMGYQAGLFRVRDTQRENLMGAGYTPAQINDYFARTDATLARNAAEAAMRGDRDSVMQPMSNYEDLARGFAQEYNIVGRNRAQLMPLLEAFLRGRGILDPSGYSENIFNTLSIPMQRGGSVELNEIYQKYMPFTSDRDMIGQMERYLENIRRAQGGADERVQRERDAAIAAFAPPPRPTPNDYLRQKGETPEIESYRQAAIKAAEKYGIPPNIFLSLVRTESNFNPLAKSGKGAMGLVQLMPKTAEELGVTDPFDPMQSLDGGARYLAQQYNRFGEWPLALSAYNAGASNVLKYDGIPPFEETKNYVDKVMRGAGILKYADGGAVDLREMYRKYADGGAVLSPDDPFYVPPEPSISPGTADEIRARALANRQRMAEEDTFGDTAAAMASGPWQEAARRMSIAGSREGVAGLFPEAQNPYLRALQSAQGYIGDVGLAGLSAAEAGAAGLGGLMAEAAPQGLIERLPGAVRRSPADFERKLAEELVYGIPESMAGMAGGRALTALDDAIESARMVPTGAMMELDRMLEAYDPNVLGSNLGNIGGTPRAPRLVSPEERNVISTGAKRGNVTAVTDQVAAQKMSYPSADGWAQGAMQVTKVKPKKGKYEIVYKEVPYGFEKPPENMSPAQWQQEMVGREVDEIRKLAQRAKSGDQAAIDIIKQANWYRGIRNTLRSELGGLGDVFADVLGATSAQTGVEMNWRNAVEIMRRFSRGEYDDEIRMYQEMLDKGDVNPTTLQKMHKDPKNPFKLITSSAGALFNTNSPAATKALFDMFRVAKGAPKTPNFTGNLIGYTNAATVDVWDARHLRRLAGLPRLPPPVEKGVTGGHLKGSTLEAPRIGGEFGFGQAVKRDAAKIINEEGIIRDVAPQFEDMNPDDLQAVAWFLEKELWTRNGWTNKAGEGGSFEYEAALAGAESPEAVNALRRQLNETFKPPPQRKRETDEQYAQRVAGAQEAFNARQAVAQDELDAMKAPFARYVLGISVERPDVRPTNVRQAEIAAQLGEPAKIDPNVVMYQINNTYGRFMQSDERAFNAEFVVRKNFDPTNVTRRMVEVAKQADQDAAFISKVMPQRTETSRPGVEIYFRKRQSPEFARTLSDKLTEYGVDGFTFVTDNRVMDRPGAQAGLEGEAIAGINGLRFQYIPEFDMGREAWEAMSPEEKAAKIDEIEELYDDIARDIVKTEPGISAANLMYYDTNVIDRERYDDFLK